MSEVRQFQKLLGNGGWLAPSGKRYTIDWCPLCDVISAACDKCHGSTCNCGGCDECRDDLKYFYENCEHHILNHLSDEEKNVLKKIRELKHLLLKSLLTGFNKLDFKKLQEMGKMSEFQEEMFSKEIKK